MALVLLILMVVALLVPGGVAATEPLLRPVGLVNVLLVVVGLQRRR